MFILRSEQIKQNLIREIKGIPTKGEPWIAYEIKPPTKTRQQEKYWHKLMDLLCKHTGEGVEICKIRTKFAVLPLYEVFVEINGVKQLIPYPVSSKGISTKQYGELIDRTLIECMDNGVVVPDPSYYGYDFNVE